MKENEHLKTENSKCLKQIMKLEQINSYVVTAQYNRDKLIEELTKENKELKNSIQNYQNKLKAQKKNEAVPMINTTARWITPSKTPKYTDKKEKFTENSASLPYLNSMNSIKNSNTPKRSSIRVGN